ncbi:hypothetical protein M0657_012172 [Pyricularia oryzae]|nr:hypothetical protein M0657_012172 [Pyricularia oryzae]
MIPTRQDLKLLILAVDSTIRSVGFIYTSIANITVQSIQSSNLQVKTTGPRCDQASIRRKAEYRRI